MNEESTGQFPHCPPDENKDGHENVEKKSEDSHKVQIVRLLVVRLQCGGVLRLRLQEGRFLGSQVAEGVASHTILIAVIVNRSLLYSFIYCFASDTYTS